MRLRLAPLAPVFLAMSLGECAFIPQSAPRLDEAGRLIEAARHDADVSFYAQAELRAASELLERARVERDTLGDAAVVEHLAYLAKQRLAIAIEAARLGEANDSVRRLVVLREASR